MTSRCIPKTDRRVCSDCLRDEVLSKEIKHSGQKGVCHYCKKRKVCWTLRTLFERIDETLKYILSIGEEIPSFCEESDRPDWSREGEPLQEILSQILECDEEVSEDLTEAFDDLDDYDPRDGGEAFYYSYENYEIKLGGFKFRLQHPDHWMTPAGA